MKSAHEVHSFPRFLQLAAVGLVMSWFGAFAGCDQKQDGEPATRKDQPAPQATPRPVEPRSPRALEPMTPAKVAPVTPAAPRKATPQPAATPPPSRPTEPKPEVPKETSPKEREPEPRSPQAEGKRVEYAPHVTIDWSVPSVEVDAEVVLREGLLELLLCSRGTKEHESILVTDAQPLKIFEALGLIGIEPGHPVRYDEASERYLPPTGGRLSIDIETAISGEKKFAAAHEWMVGSERLKPIEPIGWVFAGSQEIDGRYGADAEGTVVCVVDFATAIVAPGALHSDSDAELWLAANTAAIPQAGTACKVIFRAFDNDALILQVTPEMYFLWEDRILAPLELDAIVRYRVRHYPDQEVQLSAVEGTRRSIALFAARSIVGSGIKREKMALNLPEEPESQPAGTEQAP